MVPSPSNPQDWDRYAYSRNNPVRYYDPSGHWPEWPDILDYLQGAAYQFTNDMTLGVVDDIAASYSVCMDCNASDAYKQGQKSGRVASTVVASVEQVVGAAAVGIGSAGVASTGGPALTCTIVTGGACALPSGSVIALEVATVLVGGLAYAQGSAVVAYAQNNPLGGTPRTPIEIRKSISSLNKRIAEHEAKLKAYIEDPYAFDNQGLLRNAPSDEIRQRIINGRINHLQHEINTWRKEVDALKALLDN